MAGAHEIGGQQLTDYWFYVRHRWAFDLVLSNPDAVKLYRMSPQQYVVAGAVTWGFWLERAKGIEPS